MIIKCTDQETGNLKELYEPIKGWLNVPLSDRQLQDAQVWPQRNGKLRVLPGDMKVYIEGTPEEIAEVFEDHTEDIERRYKDG